MYFIFVHFHRDALKYLSATIKEASGKTENK
jgi:hypothetical protein